MNITPARKPVNVIVKYSKVKDITDKDLTSSIVMYCNDHDNCYIGGSCQYIKNHSKFLFNLGETLLY